MTLVRTFAAALVFCSLPSFCQVTPQPNFPKKPDLGIKTTPSSDPWRIVPPAATPQDPLARILSASTPYAINKDRGFNLNLSPPLEADKMGVWPDGESGADSVCYTIRSYVVARDSKDSDSVHPVAYSTCQPATRYRLRSAVLTGSSDAP
jgi:hypothetical protein